MPQYTFNVDLKFTNMGIEGDTKEDARDILKEQYLQTNGIELADKEITLLQESLWYRFCDEVKRLFKW